MKFFLDTAKIEEIRRAKELGVLDGVTTNPSHVAATGKTFRQVVDEILTELQEEPVSLEVVATDKEGIVKEARELARLAPNVVVKVPTIVEGVKAMKVLSQEGVKINATLCFSSLQALLVAKAGATYVSPFVGRLDAIGHEGMGIVEEIRQIYDNYDFSTEILVAAVRHPQHVLEAALIGADVITLRLETLEQLFQHPLTDVGLERFLKDWQKVPQ
ncbi:fructose-6-phosphate aldolase [Limnochorda pilosa]|uniref:Probable transaldolase n=1 Tax=Limnochorda pilosa TaxID=1555112 RepID=A0A0K2SL33_LIMPI|nr:fructose-6-phosphate aldolase [Limnochorda pilosa]BAS27810.1 transaldolase [Limnochorda pilosa]